MIVIIFQHLLLLILTQGNFDRGWRVGWQSRVETNSAADRKGNTSGTFWDWGRGKTVPVVQSLPNLHQVSGIKESISALAFHVWLNHPGQCVRCWTKWIHSPKRKVEEEDLGLNTVQANWVSTGKSRVCTMSNKNVLFPVIIILFYHDFHLCLTFKYSITFGISPLRIQYIEQTAVKW